MIDDLSMLETQIRALEKENRALKKTLWDHYAGAALSGLLSYYGDQCFIADSDGHISMRAAVADHADQMLVIREERDGSKDCAVDFRETKKLTRVPAIVFYPAGSLGECVEMEGGAA